MVKSIFAESHGSAGARSIAIIATDRDLPLSRYRAGRLMKHCQLYSCQQPAHASKKATQEHVAIPNHLDRDFDVTAPDQVWCGDVTYIWTGVRWAYLAVVMDLFARKPIGWAFSNSPNSQLTAAALSMAFELRGRPKGVMFHSDQGCHYTSRKFRQYMAVSNQTKHEPPGKLLGYSPMECFFRSLKTEWVPQTGYRSFTEAKTAILDCIIGYYSQVRPHQHNAGKAPNVAEELYWNNSYPVAN